MGFHAGRSSTLPRRFFFVLRLMNFIPRLAAFGLVRFSAFAVPSVPVGVVQPGFAAADCDELVGDEIDRAITWKKQSAVGALAGRSIRLRFHLQDVYLHAFQFQP